MLVRSADGVIVAGELYDRLPPTAAHLLASQADDPVPHRTRMAVVARATRRLAGPVSGRLTVNLTIRDGWEAEAED